MPKSLLIRQLNQELLVAAQMAYFSGVMKKASLSEQFLKCAKEEIEHFSLVVNTILELGFESDIQPIQIELESDEIRALIILEAMEETMIHYYEELVPTLEEPFKSRMKEQLKLEKEHKDLMQKLLKEAKENLGNDSTPSN